MAATLQARYFSGPSGGTGVDATTGIRFNREDTQMGTGVGIPIPTTSNITVFSYYKSIALVVTVAEPTGLITTRSVKLGTNVTLPLGVFLYFMSTGIYRQSSNSTRPPDMPSNQAVPADPDGDGTYLLLAPIAQVYDPAVVTSGATGRNGNFMRIILGIDGRFSGGPGALTLPNIIVGYDES